MEIEYVNHETGETYENKDLAMQAYRSGQRIDLYSWSEIWGQWVMRGYWAT